MTPFALLAELVAAAEESCSPDTTDDVAAMLRYGAAYKAARALIAAGEPVSVPRERAIHMFRIGDYVIVSVEHDGKWIEVMCEYLESNFSHIIEPPGIQSRIDAATGVKND